jgi:hypothetical protein
VPAGFIASGARCAMHTYSAWARTCRH